MSKKKSKFDIAEYLDDEEMVAEYLNTPLGRRRF